MPISPAEFRAKLPLVVGWIRDTLAVHAGRTRTVASLGFGRLPQYFERSTLERTNVVLVDRLPVPPLSRMGLPQFSEMERFTFGGITYLNTFFVTVGEEHNESLHFHELIHVIQWQLLGPERFLALYAAGLEQHGYRASPLEDMAYRAQERFDRAIIFDAERYVVDRLRTKSR